MANGKFVISLDFEIYWGVRDAVTLEQYREHLLGVRQAIPLLLELFNTYGIQATFATVGFLFFDSREALLKSLPERKPSYENPALSPYTGHLEKIGPDEAADPYHFGRKLLQKIVDAGQEVGSHSFSHYYCLERGQSPQDFREDLAAAKSIAADAGLELKSFVFPRNQYSDIYKRTCSQMGFSSFRGNEKSWLFSSENHGRGILLRRPFRLLDSYVNLSGHNCYQLDKLERSPLLDIPSSRFLRPSSKKFHLLEKMRLKRIKDSMTFAAKQGRLYHLWWHPHNFGRHLESNGAFLENILEHHQKLHDAFGFESRSMGQLAKELADE